MNDLFAVPYIHLLRDPTWNRWWSNSTVLKNFIAQNGACPWAAWSRPTTSLQGTQFFKVPANSTLHLPMTQCNQHTLTPSLCTHKDANNPRYVNLLHMKDLVQKFYQSWSIQLGVIIKVEFQRWSCDVQSFTMKTFVHVIWWSKFLSFHGFMLY